MAIKDAAGRTLATWQTDSVDASLRDLFYRRTFELGNQEMLVERGPFESDAIAARIWSPDMTPVALVMSEDDYMEMVEDALTRHVQWSDSQPEAEVLRRERELNAL